MAAKFPEQNFYNLKTPTKAVKQFDGGKKISLTNGFENKDENSNGGTNMLDCHSKEYEGNIPHLTNGVSKDKSDDDTSDALTNGDSNIGINSTNYENHSANNKNDLGEKTPLPSEDSYLGMFVEIEEPIFVKCNNCSGTYIQTAFPDHKERCQLTQGTKVQALTDTVTKNQNDKSNNKSRRRGAAKPPPVNSRKIQVKSLVNGNIKQHTFTRRASPHISENDSLSSTSSILSKTDKVENLNHNSTPESDPRQSSNNCSKFEYQSQLKANCSTSFWEKNCVPDTVNEKQDANRKSKERVDSLRTVQKKTLENQNNEQPAACVPDTVNEKQDANRKSKKRIDSLRTVQEKSLENQINEQSAFTGHSSPHISEKDSTSLSSSILLKTDKVGNPPTPESDSRQSSVSSSNNCNPTLFWNNCVLDTVNEKQDAYCKSRKRVDSIRKVESLPGDSDYTQMLNEIDEEVTSEKGYAVSEPDVQNLTSSSDNCEERVQKLNSQISIMKSTGFGREIDTHEDTLYGRVNEAKKVIANRQVKIENRKISSDTKLKLGKKQSICSQRLLTFREKEPILPELKCILDRKNLKTVGSSLKGAKSSSSSSSSSDFTNLCNTLKLIKDKLKISEDEGSCLSSGISKRTKESNFVRNPFISLHYTKQSKSILRKPSPSFPNDSKESGNTPSSEFSIGDYATQQNVPTNNMTVPRQSSYSAQNVSCFNNKGDWLLGCSGTGPGPPPNSLKRAKRNLERDNDDSSEIDDESKIKILTKRSKPR